MPKELPDYESIAIGVFDRIQNDFPHLTMKLTGPIEHVNLDLEIPKQPGLSFEIGLNLQNDELHLCASGFWNEWFPCSDTDVVENYFEAVTGLIRGTHRLKETLRGKTVVKSILQEPDKKGWVDMAHYYCLHIPWFRKKSIRIIINKEASICPSAMDVSSLTPP